MRFAINVVYDDVSSTCMNSLVVYTLLLYVEKCSCDDDANHR